MIFSSVSFLILFLPVTVFLYFLIRDIRYKNIVLCISSIVFYALGEPVYVFLLLGMTFFNWLMMFIRPKTPAGKAVMYITVVSDAAVLVLFKTFFKNDLPIGISFYTFQMLSYCFDTYKDNSPVQRNPLKFLLYVSAFPQLIAGPIVRYGDIASQIESRQHSFEKTASGIKRFMTGLSKKVLVANTVAKVVDHVYSVDPGSLNVVMSVTAAVLYCLQIYYDFSGYSDMAIGLMKIFGFDIKENFEHPYSACSLKEFWRRWHISLSSWFKEYVYIPLGGNRKGRIRTVVNKYIVFILTGLWHGVSLNFLIWGLIHGTGLMIENAVAGKKDRKPGVIGYFCTALIVVTAFVFFRSETLSSAAGIFKGMTVFSFDNAAMRLFLTYFDPVLMITVIVALTAMFDIGKLIPAGIRCGRGYEITTYVLATVLFALSFLSLVNGGYNPFIYYRF